MPRYITSSSGEYIATVTSKGQITIPAKVRKHLNLDKHHKLALVIKPNGAVHLQAPKYPTLESVFGSVKPLNTPVTLKEMRETIANEIAAHHLHQSK